MPKGEIRESLCFRARAGQVAKLPLHAQQHCYTHGGPCPSAVPVDFEIAGLPCQDNSRANQKRQFFEGNHGSVYLVWAKRHTELKTPLLIVENTPDAQLKRQFEPTRAENIGDLCFLKPLHSLLKLSTQGHSKGPACFNLARL